MATHPNLLSRLDPQMIGQSRMAYIKGVIGFDSVREVCPTIPGLRSRKD